ncbi:unnamed protein product [Rangifer tarandus platyrhynchus]|uniref:MAGE domain-containing protein n=1 Tax=Rangifer tarandus platyrhynchus TaxID=3082113 RepID=A0ABN9A5E9_RANTA|nr:unnamed protein product [Rangifer tarandus platyrhynchus]
MVEMSELSKPKEDLQDPGEAQGPEEAQLLGAEGRKAASPSASSPQVSSSAPVEALPQEALNIMVAKMVKFLLCKYRANEPTSYAELLNTVLGDNQDHYPVVFCQAIECILLVFGVDMKEVDPGSTSTSWSPTWASPVMQCREVGRACPRPASW